MNTYTGVTNVLQGTLNVGGGGDHAFFNTTNNGQGDLLVVGGNTTPGTVVATVLDMENNIPNNTNTVVNSTGLFAIPANAASGDVVGGFLLNGGTVFISTANDVDDGITALPSAIPSSISGAFKRVAPRRPSVPCTCQSTYSPVPGRRPASTS